MRAAISGSVGVQPSRQGGVIVARWSPVDGGETRASAIPDVDVSRSDGHDKAPEGAQAVLGLW
ncbi:MAG: hypothetical protein V2A73_06240, partial [Pseudomonadota bacterium]